MAWVAAVAGAACVFLNSSFFWVKSVQVLGNARVKTEEIVAAAALPEGVNILKAPLGEAAERVAGIPLVKSVTCRRRFPDTIEIVVTERKAAAVTPHHNSFVVLDEDGWAMEVRQAPGGLPLVTADPVSKMVVGQQADSQALRWAIQCAAAFGPRVGDVAEVHCDSKNQITVYMTGGLRGLLGQADSTIERKVGVLLGIINDVKQSGLEVEYVDLRYEKPVVKPRQKSRPG